MENQSVTVRSKLIDKPNKQGQCPVKIIVTVDGKRVHISTGIRLLPKDWDPEMLQVRRTVTNHHFLNQKIKQRIEKIEAENLKKELAGQRVALNDYGKKKSPIITEFAADLIATLTDLSIGRIKHFKTEITRLNKYSPGLRFDDVDYNFLRKFKLFLMEEEKLKPNTTLSSVWKIYRKFFREARKAKITTNDPFEGFDNPKYKDPETIYLEEHEVEAIENLLKLPLDEQLYITINYFLLGCYSGLRYSDWARFNYDGFVRGGRLILRAKKNGEIISMKIHSRLGVILEKLKTLPPCFSGNETRVHLESIAKLAGIKKNITTHTGRHTFGTQCAEKDISIETTAALMGIDIRTAKVYYKITGRKLDADIDKWDK